MKLEKFDLFQKELHATKVAQLEVPLDKHYQFVVRMIMQDMADKLNEIVDYINLHEGNEVRVNERMLRKSNLEYEQVLPHFIEEDDIVLVTEAEELFSSIERPWDVIMIRDVTPDTLNWRAAVEHALVVSKKRVIVGVRKDMENEWGMFMARVPYHWMNHEQSPESPYEWYVIDKEEGNAAMDSTSANA